MLLVETMHRENKQRLKMDSKMAGQEPGGRRMGCGGWATCWLGQGGGAGQLPSQLQLPPIQRV